MLSKCHIIYPSKNPVRQIHTPHFRASQVALVLKNLSANAGEKRRGFDPWVGKIPWISATHLGIPAWRIPRTLEPGELQSMRSQGVGHD